MRRAQILNSRVFGGIWSKKPSHFLLKALFTFLFFISLFFVKITPIYAATLYVDVNLSGNCISNYSISNRTCSGSDGSAYTNVASGVGAISAGDTLKIRGGTYTISSSISVPFSSSLTTTIQGYESENVTIHKTIIPGALFGLGNVNNIYFKNLNLTGVPYLVITGWTNYSANVWQASLPALSTQIRFNTTNGTQVGSIAALVSANQYYWSAGTIYVYSTTNPTTAYTNPGINEADNFDAVGIGDGGSVNGVGNLVTVDNVSFDSFAHVGVKGNWRWHVLNSKFTNIGTDGNDHNIYDPGVQSSGNESVYEYNYFGYTPGAAIHFYTSPSYAIVRYNVFNGLSGSNTGFNGILAGGTHDKIYNNTFYGWNCGVTLYKAGSQYNDVQNNVFSNNNNDLCVDAGGPSYPTNNTFTHNYLGSNSKCSGCADYSGSGGPNLSTLSSSGNTYSTSSWTKFTYTFTATSVGNLIFFNTCGGGVGPSLGAWYLDDISVTPSGGGAEQVTNGGMEGTYIGGLAPSWSVGSGNQGQSTSVVHSGSSSQEVTIGGSCGERIEQFLNLTAGATYILSGWAKRDSGSGILPVYFPGGNTSFTIGSLGPAFLGNAPYSSSTDFKVDQTGTDASLIDDTGANLGSDNQMGLDSNSISWPIGTINQNFYGSGWDMGAFVYNTHPAAPAISAVVSSMNSLSALITWITDKNSTSQVDYGRTTNYGSSTTLADSASGATKHSVTLSNLVGCSVYHYRVRSIDGASQEVLGADNTVNVTSGCPGTLQCTNSVPTVTPWIWQITPNGKDSITLYFTNWSSNVDHFALEYGTAPNNYQYAAANIGGGGVTSYTVNYLQPNTSYYFRIRAGNGCAVGSWSNETSGKTLGLATSNSLNIINSTLTPINNTNANSQPAFANTTQEQTNNQSYSLSVKVKDTKGKPVERAIVTIHSVVQTQKTDKNGVAKFTNVEAGPHNVLIAYNNFQGEENINLTADSNTKTFELNVTVQEQNVLSSGQFIGLGALLLVGLLFFGFILYKILKK